MKSYELESKRNSLLSRSELGQAANLFISHPV